MRKFLLAATAVLSLCALPDRAHAWWLGHSDKCQYFDQHSLEWVDIPVYGGRCLGYAAPGQIASWYGHPGYGRAHWRGRSYGRHHQRRHGLRTRS